MSKYEKFALALFIILEFVATRHADNSWLLLFAGMAGGLFVMLPFPSKEQAK